MQTITQEGIEVEITEGQAVSSVYRYPQTPFECIGFALSGGGFRAATYGLGVLSLMNEITWTEDGQEQNLREKIKFVSSASGGTITLTTYVAALFDQIPFLDFYHFLNGALTGENLMDKAITLLNDQGKWTLDGKSRNMINAFAKVYHKELFSGPQKKASTIGDIKTVKKGTVAPHIEEYCFNATEFYTGISFRFIGGHTRSGVFGNKNIHVNDAEPQAKAHLNKIRIADVLAASSCFPLGFEPIVFPTDFTYRGGPSTKELKDSITLSTVSYDENKTPAENEESKRALTEKEFSDAKTFGLMDGGICDNQGLYSLLLADKRGNKNKTPKDVYHRFDLMMVSDVTSFYMSPYKVPKTKTDKKWMKHTAGHYWEKLVSYAGLIPKWLNNLVLIMFGIAIVFSLPLVLEGVSFASVILAFLGLILLVAAFRIRIVYKKWLHRTPIINDSLKQTSLANLLRVYWQSAKFEARTAYKILSYIQTIQLGVLMQMIQARVASAVTMISDVFLKHIRRLIFELAFSSSRNTYRTVANFIYDLTATNEDNKRAPQFDPKEKETDELYNERQKKFLQQFQKLALVSPAMRTTAETAYTTGTTLWFEQNQEQAEKDGKENNRKSLIATGQFTTCYNLLGYALGLQHSRHFTSLESKYQVRIESIISQLAALMKAFEKDPYYLYNSLEGKKK